MMYGLAVVFAIVPAQVVDVPYATPYCPLNIPFVVDTTMPGSIFSDSPEQDLSTLQWGRHVDQACAIWGRLSMAPQQCRQNGATQDLGDNPFWDGVSAVTVQAMATPTGAAALWPFGSDCDLVFVRDVSNPPPPQLPFRFSSSHELDPAGISSPAEAFSGRTSFRLRGGADADDFDLSYQLTLLHEVGHGLGFTHPAECNGGTFHCPVMSQMPSRGTYYPTSNEVRKIAVSRGVEIRTVGLSGGRFGSPTFSCDLGNNVTVVPPRLACSPHPAPNHVCVATTRPTWGSSPRFIFLNTPAGAACTIKEVQAGGLWSDGAVDVALGVNGRMVAVGSRSVDLSSPRHLTIYRTDLNGTMVATIQSGVTAQTIRSHSEPRISYLEPSNRFVVVYPDETAIVRVLTLDANGDPDPPFSEGISANRISLGVASILPVDIACDTHLIGNHHGCMVYVQPHSFDNDSQNLAIRRIAVTINPTTGQASVGASFDTSEVGLLIADATTYGENPNGIYINAHFLSLDRPSSFSGSTVHVMLDSDAFFNPADTASATMELMTASGITAAYRVNTSSWDWNERAGAFYVASPK